MTQKHSIKDLRIFGLLVGGILGVIGLWPAVFRGQDFRLWALVLAGILVIPALVAPKILGPVHRVWMVIGHLLGWLNTRILLGLVFFGLFTPMGLVMRALGKDPMRRSLEGSVETYRVRRSSRPGSHLLRQF